MGKQTLVSLCSFFWLLALSQSHSSQFLSRSQQSPDTQPWPTSPCTHITSIDRSYDRNHPEYLVRKFWYELSKPHPRIFKTQIHEKSTKEQRNQNQPRPMRINQRTEKSKQPIHMRNQPKEQRNHIQPIPIRNQPKEHTQKSNSTNKSTNPRFMRRKEVEH